MGEAAVPRPRVHRAFGSTVEVTVGGTPGVLTVGRDPDGAPCWVELWAGVHGSTAAGFADALATAITIGLRHGVPAAAYTDALHRAVLATSGEPPAALLVETSTPADGCGVAGVVGR